MKLNIGDTLRFFRTSLNLMQKEMMPSSKNPSTYSRIESDSRTIKIDELVEILDNADINIYEFISYSNLDKLQKDFRADYYAASADIENPVKKNKILDYYNKLSARKMKNVLELSNYISIKVYFHQFWPEIETITEEDKQQVFALLSNKTYFLQYDYTLLSNMIYLLPPVQREALIEKAYPIKDQDKRDPITLKYAYTAIPNLITIYLHENNLKAALKYIKIADNLIKNQDNMKAQLEVNYLKNLILFLETGDIDYANKLNNYINTLKEIGNIGQAERTIQEIKDFTYKKRHPDTPPTHIK
ncbi:XRE family transcriptional regulator [Enterococcus sp. BWB1-3]|uniref:helix-turn-helix domain-containing protein n=1 Tax=unclassified Enterococcus TaxID=2608891 RepID=UPI0019249A42|nr:MULTISPECIES: helix-turn-helix transcriptional regulator [unclassified Enterococcus]MBL1229564.1 XRE family transcriptional regulator [Enterococcus sp. BWB1-3]MCB5950746.1 helix-turn-helix domain-containing protein [Enterococcus sp. BWT-B8]MCB5955985.1 helix-turn-helix domain-containing protein [Enterococcus sp. CWB-B31]